MASIEARAGATGAPARPVAAAMARPTAKRTFITWTALAMMITGSVASLRSAPTMAVFGLASVFLYVVPAIVFLVPTSLVSAELASGWKGGVYNWVGQGLSAPIAGKSHCAPYGWPDPRSEVRNAMYCPHPWRGANSRFSGSSRPARPQMLKYVIARGPTRPAGAVLGSHGHFSSSPCRTHPGAAKA